MINEESLDFRKVMQQQINKKVKPMVKKYGLRQARGNAFILENDKVIFQLIYGFHRSYEISCVFEICPIYAVIKGSCDGLPLQEEKMRKWGKRMACSNRTTFASQEEKEEVIRIFDERLRYIESTMHYCTEIDSFEKYIAQVLRNKEYRLKNRGISNEPDIYESYIFGVYDCMQKKYDEGREKLIYVIKDDEEKHGSELINDVKNKTLDEIKNNDSLGLHYKFTQMFLDAIDAKETDREERFQEAFELVCNRMRKFYGMKNS